MELESVVKAVGQWPVSERLKLLEAVWDGLSTNELQPELSAETKTLLAERVAASDARPEEGMTWDEIVARVKRPK